MSHGFKTGCEMESGDPGYYMEPGFDWSKVHTKALLDLRISQCARENPDFHAKIIEVLATREHVPNKIEAKAMRQQLAKAQKNMTKHGR